jgi:hypothetical protein
MEKPLRGDRKKFDYQPVLLEKIKTLRDGRIAIIKQDDRVIQINVSDWVDVPLAKQREGAR